MASRSASTSLYGEHAASKYLFCLPDGVFFSPSSEKNRFPLSLNQVSCQGIRAIEEVKFVFFCTDVPSSHYRNQTTKIYRCYSLGNPLTLQSLGFARGNTMIVRLRSWWQKRSKPLIVGAITIVVVGMLALVLFGYLLRLAWTGFFNKTLWDWLQLLIVPLVLAIIALVFQLANSRTERQIAKQRYEQDQQIALDKQHEDLLQVYLDRISELLHKE